MRMRGVSAAVLCAAFAAAAGVCDASVSILYSFDGWPTHDGDQPAGGIVTDGSAFYGMTSKGGANDKGTLFSCDIQGGTVTILHSFDGTDGQKPMGGLLLEGGVLYGMASEGGANGMGTAFSIGTDGSAFTLLHSFAGGSDDGSAPKSDLVSDGTTLYGVTTEGGANNKGTVFSMGKDGGSLSVLRSFAGGAGDGNAPTGSLVLAGSVLYGTSYFGGNEESGTIYSIGTDGSAFTLLRSFSGIDGWNPWSGLTIEEGVLYGTARGGANGAGTVYSIATDGSGFTLLHNFNGRTDGYNPMCVLASDGNTLYGTTAAGGANSAGTIFSIGKNGSGFMTLHNFGGNGGESPWGTLAWSGESLCGVTVRGGAGLVMAGTIFSWTRDPVSIRISFQPAGAPAPPAPWSIDIGDAFGGAWPWGWLLERTGSAARR